jgi:DNA mismatch repair protein MutL
MIHFSRQNRESAFIASRSTSGGFGPDRNDWQQLYKDLWPGKPNPAEELITESGFNPDVPSNLQGDFGENTNQDDDFLSINQPVQIHNCYILSQIKSGYILIDQKSAHERILYEKYISALENTQIPSQQELFPISLELNPEKSAILLELLPKLNDLGFLVEEFGRNSFIIKGLPVGLQAGTDGREMVVQIIEHYAENLEFQLGINENLARSFAFNASVKRGKKLSTDEMQLLIDELFACENPYNSPIGRKCFITYDLNEINRKFTGGSKI